MNKKDYETLTNCIETAKRDDGSEYKRKKEETPEHIKTIVQDVMYENDQHDFELDYDIMDDALMFLSEIELKDLSPDIDIYEYDNEFASIYTATRLSYLNVWTQDEISEKQKEFECDIAEACAVWYNEQVTNVIHALIAKIT